MEWPKQSIFKNRLIRVINLIYLNDCINEKDIITHFRLWGLFTSCSTLKRIVDKPTSFETVSALKEILNSSAFRAHKTINKMKKDGAMGVLPAEVAQVLNSLKSLGFEKEINRATAEIERVSNIVAEESTGLMKDAIDELTFRDAVSVVVGGEDAATQVFREAMYGAVTKRYSQRLDEELQKTEVIKYWSIASTTYNLFAKEKMEESLSEYLAKRAVDGLFLSMGKEEKEIRRDPASLGKAVVTKVFDYYTKGKG